MYARGHFRLECFFKYSLDLATSYTHWTTSTSYYPLGLLLWDIMTYLIPMS
jgi:hypothetical protein